MFPSPTIPNSVESSALNGGGADNKQQVQNFMTALQGVGAGSNNAQMNPMQPQANTPNSNLGPMQQSNPGYGGLSYNGNNTMQSGNPATNPANGQPWSPNTYGAAISANLPTNYNNSDPNHLTPFMPGSGLQPITLQQAQANGPTQAQAAGNPELQAYYDALQGAPSTYPMYNTAPGGVANPTQDQIMNSGYYNTQGMYTPPQINPNVTSNPTPQQLQQGYYQGTPGQAGYNPPQSTYVPPTSYTGPTTGPLANNAESNYAYLLNAPL
jgi:hypothetical protein